MEILFVNACVRKESRTLTLCRKYLEKYDSCEIKEVELQTSGLLPFDEKMLEKRNEDIARGNLSGSRYSYAKDFADADMILIGAPFWDNSFPSYLKVYFEHICVNGLTFGYSPEGKPLSLCKAKELVYITTAGGYISKRGSCEAYIRDMCDMFGIEKVRFIAAEGLDIIGNDPEKILEETEEKMR